MNRAKRRRKNATRMRRYRPWRNVQADGEMPVTSMHTIYSVRPYCLQIFQSRSLFTESYTFWMSMKHINIGLLNSRDFSMTTFSVKTWSTVDLLVLKPPRLGEKYHDSCRIGSCLLCSWRGESEWPTSNHPQSPQSSIYQRRSHGARWPQWYLQLSAGQLWYHHFQGRVYSSFCLGLAELRRL